MTEDKEPDEIIEQRNFLHEYCDVGEEQIRRAAEKDVNNNYNNSIEEEYIYEKILVPVIQAVINNETVVKSTNNEINIIQKEKILQYPHHVSREFGLPTDIMASFLTSALSNKNIKFDDILKQEGIMSHAQSKQ